MDEVIERIIENLSQARSALSQALDRGQNYEGAPDWLNEGMRRVDADLDELITALEDGE